MNRINNDLDPLVKDKSHKKHKFTPEEDHTLKLLVAEFGDKKWFHIGKLMKNRSGRQCRERWMNYLRPNIRTQAWSREEDQFILEKYQELGPCWRHIATLLDGRSEISVKNRFKSLNRKNFIPKVRPIAATTAVRIDTPKPASEHTTEQLNASMFNFDDTVYELFGNQEFQTRI